MSRVRINRKVVKLKEERKHYLSGNTLYAEGRTQGDVKAMRDFGENIYEQNQFDSHLELTIPLPTELIKLDYVDYDSIAKDLIKSLNLEDKYGIDNVAYYVHHRDETSGRTKNDNLHVHVCYVDRVIEKNNELKLYQSNKKPYGINLINGSNIKAGVFKDDSVHHFKVESDTAKLDFSLVEEDTLEKFKVATSNGRRKKFSDEELNVVNELKNSIIRQAQSKSIGAIIYSNRLESADTNKIKLKSNTREQRQQVADVLNEIIDVYALTDTKEKYGYFNANTKEKSLEERAKEIEEQLIEAEITKEEYELKSADIPNEVKKQVAEQLEPLELKLNNKITQYEEKTKDIDQVVKTRADAIASDYVEASKKISLDTSISNVEYKQTKVFWEELKPKRRKEGLTGKAVDTYTVEEIKPLVEKLFYTVESLQRERISTEPLLHANNRLEKLVGDKGLDDVNKLNVKLLGRVTKQFVHDVYNLYKDWRADRNQIRKKHEKYDKEIAPKYSDVLEYKAMEYHKDEVFIELGILRRENFKTHEPDNIIDVREAVRSAEVEVEYDEPTR